MKILRSIPLLLIMLLAFSTAATASIDTAREIDNDADKALMEFYKEVHGGKRFLDNAKAYVIFPKVREAGFFIGGLYGEGALRINGVTDSYYSIASVSAGFTMGAQEFSLIIAITSNDALKKFMRDDDWESEVDVNIAMFDYNAEEEADDVDYGSNLVGFVFDSKGMMGNFTFEGTRFERITPDAD